MTKTEQLAEKYADDYSKYCDDCCDYETYTDIRAAYEDGAHDMLKRVLKHLKTTAGNYSVEVANAIENDIIDDIRKAMNE